MYKVGDLHINDIITVWDAFEGDSIGKIVSINPNNKYYNGYAIKVNVLFGRNLKPINKTTTVDLSNIQHVNTALIKTETVISKLIQAHKDCVAFLENERCL